MTPLGMRGVREANVSSWRRKNTFADTPMEMQPVRLEVERPRYRCDVCKNMVVPN